MIGIEALRAFLYYMNYSAPNNESFDEWFKGFGKERLYGLLVDRSDATSAKRQQWPSADEGNGLSVS